MNVSSHSEDALMQALSLEPPPLPPQTLVLPPENAPQTEETTGEMVGSDLLLGC